MANQDQLVKHLTIFKLENCLKAIILQESTTGYAAKKGSGRIQKLMLSDEEGGRIQAVIFNDDISKFKEVIKPLYTIMINNATIKTPNSKFPSVNQNMELSFGPNTNVETTNEVINLSSLLNKFVSFKDAEIATDKKIFFDIIGVLHEVRPITHGDTFTRRDVTIIDEALTPMTFTLWDNQAKLIGAEMEQLKEKNPIIAMMNITSKLYLGVPQLTVSATSSVFINPDCERAVALQDWLQKGGRNYKQVIMLQPSQAMRRASESSLEDIINASTQKEFYCYFKGRILNVINPADPCYSACDICRKTVKINGDKSHCYSCNNEQADWNVRYLLNLQVSNGPKSACVTLFEEAQKLTSCTPEHYVQALTNGVKGTLTDGTVFDSSFERGDPIEFELGSGQVIKGWDQGLLGMCVGEKRKLKIPAKMGYGDQGSPPTIPGGATLIFDTKLIAVNGKTSSDGKSAEEDSDL